MIRLSFTSRTKNSVCLLFDFSKGFLNESLSIRILLIEQKLLIESLSIRILLIVDYSFLSIAFPTGFPPENREQIIVELAPEKGIVGRGKGCYTLIQGVTVPKINPPNEN